ncbi:PhzF family phenazine biosynthesis protein [Streptacidiphilus fuscans]|uniref:PhzF family phenazine biosynthesis protein n=1 Tax=Streptacidiphilus fuscans TaxID=2789292 RepID=A0A931FGZ4_9ACTN|nr:PhzF family phenazine biosynthesis protein [Streptacidiphilus fuscans]MBF9071361.1 PhzF family phenazine biosynthesis protein [Streptacidiphilus fuscans]
MRLFVVDAFTDRPFSGNPAAVCLLPTGQWPDDAWMQRIAAEMNHSETAFALPLPDSAEAEWAIRWFTPRVEAGLCGHATLATAHALRAEKGLVGTVRFQSRNHGVLAAHADAEGAITLDFPAVPATAVPIPDGLATALGAIPEAALHSAGLGDLLAIFADESTVRVLTPDLDAVADLTTRNALRGIIVTAPAAKDTQGHDFVSRFFAPARGIPEDPVTGSAHTTLAPYWSARLGRQELTGLQTSTRSGLVRTALRGDRVHLTGNAVTILDGTLHA